MKIRNVFMSGMVCLVTSLTAFAEFTPPTDAQIQAAAADPAQLATLLNGASLEQASHVVKTVIAQIASLNLPANTLESRVGQVMSTTLTTLPASGLTAFAGMLGNEMGNSLAIRSQSAVVSDTQSALASASGAGAAVAKAFGDSFQAAASTSGNASAKEQPPTAKLYPGQN